MSLKESLESILPRETITPRVLQDLAGLSHPELPEFLRDRIGDRAAAVRLAAAYALAVGGDGSREILEILRRALALRPEPENQVLAAAALARRGIADALEVLRDALQDGTWGIFNLAFDTLVEIGDPSARARAEEELNDPETAIFAAGALARLRDLRALPILTRFLREGTPWEKVRALNGLSRLAGADTVRLTESAAADGDPWVRYACHLARARATSEPRQLEECLRAALHEIEDEV
jgi:HEAT repeat protein